MTDPTARAVSAAVVAQAWYTRQQGIARRVAEVVQAWWKLLDPAHLDASFRKIQPNITGAIGGGQMLAAIGSDSYVGSVLAAQGFTESAEGTLDPRAFAGFGYPFPTNRTTSREVQWSLQDLTRQSLIGVKEAISRGLPVDVSMARGQASIVRTATTQVQDAGRAATSVASVQRRALAKYVRLLTPPSCSRCVLLAGKVYKTEEAFLRHPNCDCINVPLADVRKAADIQISPRAYFNSLTPEQQAKTFTIAGAQAIRDGADIYQVVNARLGLASTIFHGEKVSITTVGSKRGLARKRLGSNRIPRITPEQIYKDANGNRDTALFLLHRFGYII